MITKFAAKAGIIGAQLALALTNYWFTFGLWPLSWTSFWLCGVGAVVLMALMLAINEDK